MDYVVAKPFNTVTQRMKPGMDVSPADVGALDWDHLVERGFVEPKSPPAAAMAEPPAPPPMLPPAAPALAHVDA